MSKEQTISEIEGCVKQAFHKWLESLTMDQLGIVEEFLETNQSVGSYEAFDRCHQRICGCRPEIILVIEGAIAESERARQVTVEQRRN